MPCGAVGRRWTSRASGDGARVLKKALSCGIIVFTLALRILCHVTVVRVTGTRSSTPIHGESLDLAIYEFLFLIIPQLTSC